MKSANILIKFNNNLRDFFYRFGEFIADHKALLIILPLVFTSLSFFGFRRVKFENDADELFTDSNSISHYARSKIEDLFDPIEGYKKNRITRPPKGLVIYLIAKNNESLLTVDHWKNVILLDKFVKDLKIEMDNKSIPYEDICFKSDGECSENNVLKIDHMIPSYVNGTRSIIYPFMLDPELVENYFFPLSFGGVELHPNKAIKSVKAMRLVYPLDYDFTPEHLKVIQKWENEIQFELEKYESDYFDVRYMASTSIELELDKHTRNIAPLFAIAVVGMVVFSMVSVSEKDCVKGKTWLGMVGSVFTFFPSASAYAVVIMLGIPMVAVNSVSPFLLLGIAMDDTFVFLASWQRTNPEDSVKKRMGETYADAGVSVTITSLTNVLSFLVGVLVPFRGVQIFCIYTGTAVFFVYVWHLTFFGSVLAIAGNLEKNNRHCVTGRKVEPRTDSDKRSTLFQLCCTTESGNIKEKQSAHETNQFVQVFFRDYVGYFLCYPMVKAIVICSYLVYLAIAIYGVWHIKNGLEFHKLCVYGSPFEKFAETESKYFRGFPYPYQLVLTGNYTYSDRATQDRILSFLERIEEEEHISSSYFTQSWLRAWTKFEERNLKTLNIDSDNEVKLIKNLKEYYLNDSGQYSQDIILNEDETRIVASRFMVTTYDLQRGIVELNLWNNLTRIAKEFDLEVLIYCMDSLFLEQMSQVMPVTLQSLAMAATVVTFTSFILIPEPSCALWVGLSTISIEVGVLGYMSLWDMSVDSVSMIQLILGIGFSVDYSVHITYAYLTATAPTPDGKLKEALFCLAAPILKGAFSTIIAILPLGLANSYIAHSFYKTVFLVIFFGMLHALFLLPVVLSLKGAKKNKAKINSIRVN